MKHNHLLVVLAMLGLVTLIAMVGCGRMAKEQGSASYAPKRAAYDAAAETKGASQAGADSDAVPDMPAAQMSRKIIRTGNIDLEVEDVEETSSRIRQLARESGGYVSDSNVREREDGLRYGSITLKVPAEKFDSVFEKLQSLAAEGTSVSYSQEAEDVTEEWVDLEARIENKKKAEQSLQKHLEREADLSDILAVEKELFRVRGEIEQLEGRMRYLKNQVSLSTVTVNMDEIPRAGVGGYSAWRLGYHLSNAWYSLVDFVRWLFIAIIYVVIIGAPIYIPIILLVRWIGRRRKKQKVDSPGEE
ncbi:MAG: DUF4349 domain-containing protein [Armatimonadota bacterium]